MPLRRSSHRHCQPTQCPTVGAAAAGRPSHCLPGRYLTQHDNGASGGRVQGHFQRAAVPDVHRCSWMCGGAHLQAAACKSKRCHGLQSIAWLEGTFHCKDHLPVFAKHGAKVNQSSQNAYGLDQNVIDSFPTYDRIYSQ